MDPNRIIELQNYLSPYDHFHADVIVEPSVRNTNTGERMGFTLGDLRALLIAAKTLQRIAESYDPEAEEWRDPETGYIDPDAYTIGNVEDTAYIAVSLTRNDAAKIAYEALARGGIE